MFAESNGLVQLRLVVFRPFKGEIILGKIRSCSKLGVHGIFVFLILNSVTIGFFSDLLIPPSFLPENSKLYVCIWCILSWSSDQDEQLWAWIVDGNSLYLDLEEEVKFRVISETFTEVNPCLRKSLAHEESLAAISEKISPYSIIVCSGIF